MDFKQLEAYIKVVELKSFSKAAEEIYLSQPSVSTYINNLEDKLQTQLIFRSTKEVNPTKSGEIFYRHAKNIIAMRDKSIFAMQNYSESTKGEIDINASSVPSQYILPDVLTKFNKLYPDIIFNINQSDSMDVINNIAAQKFDFGFSGMSVSNTKCEFEEIISDKLVLIAPPDFKTTDLLNENELVDLLASEKFISRERGSGTRNEYEKLISSMGLKAEDLKVIASFTNTQSIIYAVSRGLGISIVSEMAANEYIKRNWVKKIKTCLVFPKRKYFFVYKKNILLSHVSDIFIDFIRNEFKV